MLFLGPNTVPSWPREPESDKIVDNNPNGGDAMEQHLLVAAGFTAKTVPMENQSDKSLMAGIDQMVTGVSNIKPSHIREITNTTATHMDNKQAVQQRAEPKFSTDGSSILHIFDSRTSQIHHIPVFDGFVRGSDLSTITAPLPGKDGHIQKLAILDPGFQHTACKESEITLIDGEKGELRYRGIQIKELFYNHDFEETLHLLIWGHFPSDREKIDFQNRLSKAASPPQTVCDAIRSQPRHMDFISLLMIGFASYMGADEEMSSSRRKPVMTYHSNLANTDDAIVRSISYVATIMALCYCHVKGVEFCTPAPGLTLVENFLHMINMKDPNKKISRTIDRLSILFADHELSCSTAAFLHVASTMADPMACVLAAISAASGPLHVGAIEICYEALQKIGTVENVPSYIEAVKAKKFRLFGYGHRVYKTQDPRTHLIKELMEEHREAINANPLLQVAMAIDEQANSDPYFVQRKLKLNADFYGCFLYLALGIPKEMMLGLLTISRVGGLMAHWRETMTKPIKIWRPTQKYNM